MRDSTEALVRAHQATMPGIAALFSPAAIAQWIHQASAVDVRNLVLSPRYIRFKPDASCLVVFDGHADGESFLFTAKAFSRKNAVKLDKALSRGSAQGFLGLDRIVDRSRLLLGWVLPNDPILRGLKRYSADSQPNLLAYKPERRYVGTLTGPHGRKQVLKIYKKAAFTRACELARTADALPMFPKLAGIDEQRCGIRLDWIDGDTLATVAARGAPDISHGRFVATGELLASLHAHPVPDAGLARTEESIPGRLHLIARGIVEIAPHLESTVEWIASTVHRRLCVDGCREVLSHGDFYSNQVLITEGGMRLLDYDELGVASPEADLGLFIAHLEFDVLRGRLSAQQAAAASEAFLAGYARALPIDSGRLAAQIAYGMFQLAHRPFRDWMPGWPELMQQWLARIAVRLAERVEISRRSTSETATAGTELGERLMLQIQRALAESTYDTLLADAIPADVIAQGRIVQGMLIRHKPGRRALIRYTLHDADHRAFGLIGKLRAKGTDQRTFATTQAIHEIVTTDDRHLPLRVPRPLASVPDLDMWLQEEIAGTDGWSALASDDAAANALRIGEALRRLHGLDLPTRRTHGADDELSIIDQRLAAAQCEMPHLRLRIQAVWDAGRACCESLRNRPRCNAHRDFYPAQLIVDAEWVYVLDLDLFCNADPALDVGNFIAHIEESDLRNAGNPHARQHVIEAFTRGYMKHGYDPGFMSALERYRVLSLVRLFHISTGFAERRAFSNDILAYCEQQIAQLNSADSRLILAGK